MVWGLFSGGTPEGASFGTLSPSSVFFTTGLFLFAGGSFGDASCVCGTLFLFFGFSSAAPMSASSFSCVVDMCACSDPRPRVKTGVRTLRQLLCLAAEINVASGREGHEVRDDGSHCIVLE